MSDRIVDEWIEDRDKWLSRYVNLKEEYGVLLEKYDRLSDVMSEAEKLADAVRKLLEHHRCQVCGNYEFLEPVLADWEKFKEKVR